MSKTVKDIAKIFDRAISGSRFGRFLYVPARTYARYRERVLPDVRFRTGNAWDDHPLLPKLSAIEAGRRELFAPLVTDAAEWRRLAMSRGLSAKRPRLVLSGGPARVELLVCEVAIGLLQGGDINSFGFESGRLVAACNTAFGDDSFPPAA